MINVEVTKNANENNLGIIKRFTKKVQGSGILPKVRSKRYSERNMSFYNTKKRALTALKRREERDELIKMGKITEQKKY
jgi:ribosomal protein S21